MFSSENIIFFTFEICLVVFLDLIDIYTDTKITKIGTFIAKLQAHSVFRAAILKFFFRENPDLRFGSRHFWIQHTRKPQTKIFMLLSGSARQIHISAPLYQIIQLIAEVFYANRCQIVAISKNISN